MTSSWNGEVTGTGTRYRVAPPSWGATIQPGQIVTTFGFCASAPGLNMPTNVQATPL